MPFLSIILMNSEFLKDYENVSFDDLPGEKIRAKTGRKKSTPSRSPVLAQ